MLFSLLFFFFFFNDTATTEIYTLSLHDALPICYRVRKYVGAYLAASGGADALVFTGGIGENSAEVRARVCEGLAWMGVELDSSLNEQMVARREGLISREGSRLAVYVIPTDEELLIARDTVRVVRGVPQRY